MPLFNLLGKNVVNIKRNILIKKRKIVLNDDEEFFYEFVSDILII